MRFNPTLWLLSAALLCASGCGGGDHYSNPYDQRNPLTGGGVFALEIRNRDSGAELLWRGSGLEGVAAYRIYRRFSGAPSSSFERIGELSAAGEAIGDLYRFSDPEDVDGGAPLANDLFDPATGERVPYLYRVTVVDDEGAESPEPTSENEASWLGSPATPSDPPPSPVPTAAESDLRIEVRWSAYQLPDDVDAYRVYRSNDGVAWTLAEQFESRDVYRETPKLYADGDFTQDLTTRHYRIAAVDDVGVESVDAPEYRLTAAAPNLPPAPVTFTVEIVELPGGLLRAHLQWSAAPEPDAVGYSIYSRDQLDSGEWRLREQTSKQSDRELWLTEQAGAFVEYFVTAYDNTPREDGSADQIYPPGF